MKEFICIVCPKGCRLTVDDNGNVSGNTCIRGEKYGKQEAIDPKRTLTSTVKIKSKISVRNNAPQSIILSLSRIAPSGILHRHYTIL